MMLPHQHQQHQLPPHHQLSPHQLPPHPHHLQQHQQQSHVRQPHIMQQPQQPQQPQQQQQQQPPQQQLQPEQQRPQQQHVQHYQQAQAESAHPGHHIFVGHKDGRSYRLACEQQPIRARMCGFGDKDRRPITPPPCVRLIVVDTKTGVEVDPTDVDSTYFVLMVDLWHEDGSRAVNLVRHSSAAPTVSISSSTVTSYPPPPERQLYVPMPNGQWPDHMGNRGVPPPPSNPYGQQAMPQYNYPANPGNPAYAYGAPNGYAPNPSNVISIPAPPPTQNHTRNLIGMNAVNACRLKDTKDVLGFWFVLQDLSVRTEGTFRLKLSMCDVGNGTGPNASVSDGKCPVLATIFSDPFTVYSAKKFPGVIESTDLSKCFAQQGIKIPIRKDGPKNLSNQAEYDADDL